MTPSDEYADPGENVTLRCDVDSNPAPTIVWLGHGGQTVVGRGPTLTIRADQSTVGIYKCIAKVSDFPEISETVGLFLKVCVFLFSNVII